MAPPPPRESRPGASAPAGDAERYRTLLEISNAVIANLTQEALFHAIAGALRRVLPFDRTAIFLHEPERDVLRLFILESSLPSTYFVVGFEMPTGDSHVGRVFREQKLLLRRDLGAERQYPAEERAFADGVRSYVIVPLMVHGRSIGVLAMASVKPNQYSEADAAFFQEIASQVAPAVENMKAHEEIRSLNAGLLQEATRRETAEATVRSIMEGTAAVTGADFFRSLVRHLAGALLVRYAFVAECAGKTRVRTLAFWTGNGFGENFEYDVTETPCQKVLEGEACYYPGEVQARFPHDRALVDLGAESYLGLPMIDLSGQVVGHLVIMDDTPMPDTSWAIRVLMVFAARGAAELKRQQAEAGLQAALSEVQALKNRIKAENVYLQEEIHREHNFAELVGNSPRLLELLRQVEQVAPTDSTVLIMGETGTGKELVARAIHARSGRRDRPLVKVNCSAISAGLVESELFGHVKGAFTGAIERRVGRFELADGGTIFLDEVGELPPETQVKLLRVLQEMEFEPVGSSRTQRVNVRVIAATNRDLEEAVAGGRFRSDLFFRLNVFPLTVPPLRERPEDIRLLVMFFLAQFAKKFGKSVASVTDETMERLTAYAWPGNIRELQNVLERAAILSAEPTLEVAPALLPAPGGKSRSASAAPAATPAPRVLPSLEEVERSHILAALEQTGWVIEGPRGAAAVLKLHPNTLRSRLERLGIKRAVHDRP